MWTKKYKKVKKYLYGLVHVFYFRSKRTRIKKICNKNVKRMLENYKKSSEKIKTNIRKRKKLIHEGTRNLNKIAY